MPEHLRALVVVLVLAAAVFAFAKAPVCAGAMAPRDFERRRNLWFAITLAAFLAHNFWIYIVVTAALAAFAARGEPNRLAMFFFVLFAVPPIADEIAGLGGIQYFFSIHYIRLLALALLLPAFLSLYRRRDVEPFGRSLPDKLILAYLVLNVLLMLSVSTFTNTLRHGVFYAFMDVVLPYYVASRSLKDTAAFRDALSSFVVAAMVLAALAVFEIAKGWLLYSALQDALGVVWAYGGYLQRGESQRAQVTAGQPIPLGYLIAVAMGLYLYLAGSLRDGVRRQLAGLLLLAGLVAPLSRGPWVGAIVILIVFVASGPSAGERLAKLMGALAFAATAWMLLPGGRTVLEHLPFGGTVADSTIGYRQRLLRVSLDVILQNPLFGGYDFIYLPAMQDLKQGQGIVDLVNSYLGVALTSGLVGLSLFAGFFVAVGAAILKAMMALDDKAGELHRLGQALLAVLAGIMVMIFTASSISYIPVVYWAVAGLGIAYARMASRSEVRHAQGFAPLAARLGH